MITIKVELRFSPTSAINFNPTGENLKQVIAEALTYEVEDEFFHNIIEESQIEEEDKEKVEWFLTSTDIDVLLNYCNIDYDSLIFSYFDAEDIIVYTIKLYFDEDIALEN